MHIVECAPQKPDQTTAEWALESFRKLAPDPPGPVLETGKYSGVKYAYVVTKPADETMVRAWVRRYELQVEDTKETEVHTLKTEFSAPAAAPRVAPPVTPKRTAAGARSDDATVSRFRFAGEIQGAGTRDPAKCPTCATCSLNQSARRVWAARRSSLGSIQREACCTAEGDSTRCSAGSTQTLLLRRCHPSLEVVRSPANLLTSSKVHSEEIAPRTCQLTHHSQLNLRRRTWESLRLCSVRQRRR